jgi:lysophospholipase L1-like esterase
MPAILNSCLFSRRAAWVKGTLLLASLATTELFCRFRLGLGDPPLSVADPQIEYLFAPNQHRSRFGNHVDYNAWSMRSDDFPAQKSNPRELRVMVFGDSVINGGVLTDQRDVVTSILQRLLSSELGRQVVVGNISAGSWGPPNMLAYARRFGLFQADVVVLVLSSHDYADVPTFEPTVGVDPDFPDRRPWCATWEAVTRYLPRYFPRIAPTRSPTPRVPSQKDIDASLAALGELIDLAKQNGAKVLLAQHLELAELLPGRVQVGHEAIGRAARNMGITPFDLEGQGTPVHFYRDSIHPNQAGNELIATRLLSAICGVLDPAR